MIGLKRPAREEACPKPSSQQPSIFSLKEDSIKLTKLISIIAYCVAKFDIYYQIRSVLSSASLDGVLQMRL